jgi:hypothetical protein|tara:strand:- start:6452 stop:6691 length:240 start_codon:yes stop_codon:yes gene_type:complete
MLYHEWILMKMKEDNLSNEVLEALLVIEKEVNKVIQSHEESPDIASRIERNWRNIRMQISERKITNEESPDNSGTTRDR